MPGDRGRRRRVRGDTDTHALPEPPWAGKCRGDGAGEGQQTQRGQKRELETGVAQRRRRQRHQPCGEERDAVDRVALATETTTERDRSRGQCASDDRG